MMGLSKPIFEGDKVATLNVFNKDELIKTIPVYSFEKYFKSKFFQKFIYINKLFDLG